MAMRKLILQKFRERGLQIQSDACTNLISLLEDSASNANENLQSILESLTLQIHNKEIATTIITSDILINLLADLTSNQEDLEIESIQLIDAYHTPKVDYDEVSKSYKM
jgi:hypothetical protein